MSKINIDKKMQLTDPIEIIIEGKTYSVIKITTEMLKSANEIQKNENTVNALIMQLAFFTGVNPEEFNGVDIRKLGAALKAIIADIDSIKKHDLSGIEGIFTIAAAFPGQFTYIELLNLDVRDLVIWWRKAQKYLIELQLKNIQAARMAMVDNSAYCEVISALEMEIDILHRGRDEIIKDNWNDLKLIGKG